MVANIVRCNGSRGGGLGDEDGDGLTHISGEPVSGLNTICGFCDVQGVERLPTGTPVECAPCRAIYDYVRALRGVQWDENANRSKK